MFQASRLNASANSSNIRHSARGRPGLPGTLVKEDKRNMHVKRPLWSECNVRLWLLHGLCQDLQRFGAVGEVGGWNLASSLQPAISPGSLFKPSERLQYLSWVQPKTNVWNFEF